MSHDAVNWALNMPLSDHARLGEDYAHCRWILTRLADHVQPLDSGLHDEPDWYWGSLPTELGALYASGQTMAAWAGVDRSKVTFTLKACTLCGVLLRHPDQDLTRALTMSVTAKRYQPSGNRNNAPVTYLLNDRITKKGAAGWLPDAFHLAVKYAKLTKKAATAEVEAEFAQQMRQLIPTTIWPDGYSFEDALNPPNRKDVLAARTVIPHPATHTASAEAEQVQQSPGSGAASVKATRRRTKDDPVVEDLVQWWIEQHPKISPARVAKVRSNQRDAMKILVDEGHSPELIRELYSTRLSGRIDPPFAYVERVLSELMEDKHAAQGVGSISSARKRRQVGKDNGIDAAVAGAGGALLSPDDDGGWGEWAVKPEG